MVGEVERHLVVMKRHERLDACFLHRLKEVAVEVDARLERLLLGARGKQTRPLDRNAQRFEAHLGKKRNVLLVTMEEIDTVALRVDMGVG